jgi:hypothetical protein
MQENKIFFCFVIFFWQHFQRKPGILILNLYLYSRKIQTNIRQNFDRKIRGKVTDFFGFFLEFFLGWAGLGPVILV